jgi:hypothetical protein
MKQVIYLAVMFWIIIISFPQSLSFADDAKRMEGVGNRLSTEIFLADLLNYAYLNNPSIIASTSSRVLKGGFIL